MEKVGGNWTPFVIVALRATEIRKLKDSIYSSIYSFSRTNIGIITSGR